MNKYPGTSDGYPFPDGLGVRIPGFHPGGPGSIPGLGAFLVPLWGKSSLFDSEFNLFNYITA